MLRRFAWYTALPMLLSASSFAADETAAPAEQAPASITPSVPAEPSPQVSGNAQSPPPTQPAAAPAGADMVLLAQYQKALEQTTTMLEDLRAELREHRDRIVVLEKALRDAGVDPNSDEVASIDPRAAERAARDKAEAERREKVAAFLADRQAQRNAGRETGGAADSTAPKWWYTWQIGYVERETGQTTFVKVRDDGAVVYVGDRTRLDPRVLIVNGTFENRSQLPYRYTFDVELVNSGSPTASTRYQTPPLGAGELHRWELTMNTSNSLGVDYVRITNIRGDAVTELDALSQEETAGPALQTTAPTPAVSYPRYDDRYDYGYDYDYGPSYYRDYWAHYPRVIIIKKPDKSDDDCETPKPTPTPGKGNKPDPDDAQSEPRRASTPQTPRFPWLQEQPGQPDRIEPKRVQTERTQTKREQVDRPQTKKVQNGSTQTKRVQTEPAKTNRAKPAKTSKPAVRREAAVAPPAPVAAEEAASSSK